MRESQRPRPATTTTEAVSASIFLDKVVHWDGSLHDIKQVLNAAFDANDYLDCIRDLQAQNIDPLLYINSLDRVGSCSIFGELSIHRDMAIDC